MSLHTAERTTSNTASENPIFQRHLVAYNQAAQLISGNVLEIGCGEGYAIKQLAAVSTQYTAVDKFQTSIDSLPANASFVQMLVPNLTSFESNTFDYVISFQVIEHIEDDHLFLKEIHRVLKPGGKLIFTTPNKTMSLSRNPWHVREYTVAQMRNIVSKYFANVDLQGVFGNKKVMEYYEKNKESVKKFTRFDVFNLQYNLPRWLLQIPYDLANRLNRSMLSKENKGLVQDIAASDYFIATTSEECLDHFCIATK